MKNNQLKKNMLPRNAATFLLGVITILLGSILNAQVDQKDEIVDNNLREKNISYNSKTHKKLLKVLKSDEKELIVEIDIPRFEIRWRTHQGCEYQIITIPGFKQTCEPGRPQLPYRGYLFGIPVGAQPNLEILDAEFTTEFNYHIYPAPRHVIQQGLPDTIGSIENLKVKEEFYINQNIYISNNFYPHEIAKINESGFIRDNQVVQLQIHPVQYKPRTKEIRWYKRMKIGINFSQRDFHYQSAKAPNQTSKAFDKILSQSIINYHAAKSWQKARIPSSQTQFEQTQYDLSQQGECYKILVEEDGIYELTKTTLEIAGLNLSGVDPRKIKMFNKGHEIAIYIRGESDRVFNDDDYIEFYGIKMNSDYTDTNIYWLTVGDSDGLRMAIKDGSLNGSPPILTRYKESIHFEQNKIYETSIPNGEGQDHWFWNYIIAPNTSNYNVDLNNVSNISDNDCLLKMEFRGYSYNSIFPDHHTIISINGQQLVDEKWDSQIKFQTQANFSQLLLTNGTNIVSVNLPGDTGAGVDIVYVNWFEIEYWRDYVAVDDILSFWGEGTGVLQFQVKNFLQNNIMVYDITDPSKVKRVTNLTPVFDGTRYTLKFQDELTTKHRYVALRPNKKKHPMAIFKDKPSQLLSKTNQADYIIITHEDFSNELGLLAYYREKQGLKSMIVKIIDVYDEFNYGIKDPKAIKDFLYYAYHNWNLPAPTYVLLVGDASYDYKDHLGTGNLDYVPTYLFESNAYNTETSTDNWFVCVSGVDILPDMLIGRLPVRSSSETELIVDKIVNYEENPAQGNWNKYVLFVADNADGGGDFENLSDYFAQSYVPADYTKSKVYLRDYSSGTAANVALISQINQGCLVANYLGHGSMDTWASEKMFVSDDIEKLTNSNKFPLVVIMSCLNGYFHHAKEPYSLAEEFLKAKFKGAIACFSPSGFGYTNADKILGDGLYSALFHEYDQILGSAVVKSKLKMFAAGHIYHDHIQFYNLLGDPALQLYLPPFIINLAKDWNLISLPRQAPDPSIQTVLDPIAGNWLQIMAYTNGEWQAAETRSDPSFWTLTEVNLGDGYWLQMNAAAQMPVYGTEKSTAIPLNKDWNLFGYPTIINQDIGDAFGSIDESWLKLLYYSKGNWMGADQSLDHVYWSLTDLEPGHGYWLEMSRQDTLEISRVPASEISILASNSENNKKDVMDDYQKGVNHKSMSGKSEIVNEHGTNSLSNTPPPLPSGFYGEIRIDNESAPVGTEVTAWINRVNYPTNFKINKVGQYGYMLVNGDISSTSKIEGGVQGDTVIFKIITLNHDTLVSNDAAIWETGVIHRKDLALNSGTIQALGINIKLRINGKIFGSEILAGDPVPSRSIFMIDFSGGEKGINEQSIQLFMNDQLINENLYSYSPNKEGSNLGGELIYLPEKLTDGQYELNVEVRDLATTPNVASAQYAFWINSELQIEKVINFPNPMQNDTKFTYNLINDNPAEVSIKIYTVAGRLIKVINAASGEVGYNETFWDGRDDFGDKIANGVYFYKLIARDGNKKAEVIERLVVMK